MESGWVVLHGGALGDLTLTLQLALRLPRVGQEGRLHVVSRIDPGDLSGCRPSITRQSTDALGCHWLYSENGAARPSRLDQVVRGMRVLSALGDSRCRAHERLLTLGPAGVFSFDPRPRPDLNRHITQQWLLDLESQGLLIPKCIHQRPGQRRLGVPDELRRQGNTLLREACRGAGFTAGCVLIHPGSGGRDKCWPLPNFLAVGRALQGHGSPVCFLIGPVEVERYSDAEWRELTDNFPVLKNPSPPDLLGVLSASRTLVANDCGPAHLAALLGTPTVTIFGPTSPTIWHPLGPDALTIAGDPQHHPTDWNIDSGRVAALAVEA